MKKQISGIVLGMLFLMHGVVAQDHSGHDMKMSMDHESGSVKQFDVSAEFQKQLNTVYQANLALSEAFVASDVSATKEKAEAMLEQLNKVDMSLVKGAAHMDWMKYSKAVSEGLNKILASSDLEAQRKSFSFVNENMYKIIKSYGVGETVYNQYCPMYKANWLSSKKDIANPYYGSKMLNCGTTKEVLN